MKIKAKIYYSLTVALISIGVITAAGAADGTLAGSYLAGQFARNSGDIDAAIASLRRVHQDDPENMEVASQLQGMLLLQGNVDEAITLASDIRQIDERDQLSDLLLALRDIKNHNVDGAAAMLDSVSEAGSAQLWLPLISAWIDVSNNKLAKPLTLEELSADVSRAAPLANYHLALINAQAGFTDAAALNFKNAIEDPKNPPSRVMELLLRFYKQNGSTVLTPVVNAYHESHPDDTDESVAPSIVTAQDGVAEVLYTMGGIMLGADVTSDAAIYLQLALYVKPDFAEAALALGDAYVQLQQYAHANDAYARVTPASPLYIRAQLHIAVNFDRMGKLNDALSMLDKMAKQSPDDADALITKGDLLRIHSRYRDAVDAYSKALGRIPELKSSHWPVLFARGACFERLGNWAAAERDLQQALVLKPDQPDVLNYLGYGWMARNENLADARAMIEKAVKARPDDAEIVDSMGWALYLSGDYEGATEYLEKAVELLPGDPTVNDHLGDAYWRLGHKTEARYQWERSLSFSPEAKLADSLHHKLKEGLPPPTTLAGAVPPDADTNPLSDATP